MIEVKSIPAKEASSLGTSHLTKEKRTMLASMG
jgi:hypothetical protein